MSHTPDVGTLDEQLIRRIATPADGANALGTLQLGPVVDAVEGFVFPQGAVYGRGKLQVVALVDADKAILNAEADEVQLTVDFLEGNTANVEHSVSSQVPEGASSKHATNPIRLPDNYGRVDITVTVPAGLGLSELAVAWTPDY